MKPCPGSICRTALSADRLDAAQAQLADLHVAADRVSRRERVRTVDRDAGQIHERPREVMIMNDHLGRRRRDVDEKVRIGPDRERRRAKGAEGVAGLGEVALGERSAGQRGEIKVAVGPHFLEQMRRDRRQVARPVSRRLPVGVDAFGEGAEGGDHGRIQSFLNSGIWSSYNL